MLYRFGFDFDSEFDPAVVGDVYKIQLTNGNRYYVHDMTARSDILSYKKRTSISTAPTDIFSITTPGIYYVNSYNFGNPFGTLSGLLFVERVSRFPSNDCMKFTVYTTDGCLTCMYFNSATQKGHTAWGLVGNALNKNSTVNVDTQFTGTVLCPNIVNPPSGSPDNIHTYKAVVESFATPGDLGSESWRSECYQKITYHSTSGNFVYDRMYKYNNLNFTYGWTEWKAI